MPDKLTDSEIVKALECCVEYKQLCPSSCPMHNDKECVPKLKKYALDLIKRLENDVMAKEYEYDDMLYQRNSVERHLEGAQAELEQYKDYTEKWMEKCDDVQAENERLKFLLECEEAKYDKCAKRFYKEGIKEFADRLKEKGFILLRHKMILSSDIDNLLKELVGE